MSKIFEIKTIQSAAIKCMIEALKELLTDTVLEINETGIKIVTMDNAHVILVHLNYMQINLNIMIVKNRFQLVLIC